jgi:hypothetical protein
VGYFWSEAQGWSLVWDQDEDEETAARSPSGGPIITWGGPPVAPKTGRNRWHFHLAPGAGSDQESEVVRLVSLGATRLDEVAGSDGRVVLADPDGNEPRVLVLGVGGFAGCRRWRARQRGCGSCGCSASAARTFSSRS